MKDSNKQSTGYVIGYINAVAWTYNCTNSNVDSLYYVIK